MEILYFSVGNVTEGVRKKLEDKAVALRNQGLHVKLLLVVTPDYNGKGNDVWGIIEDDECYVSHIITIACPLAGRNDSGAPEYHRDNGRYIKQHPSSLVLMRYPR